MKPVGTLVVLEPGVRVLIVSGELEGITGTIASTDELPPELVVCLPAGTIPVRLDPGASENMAALPAHRLEPLTAAVSDGCNARALSPGGVP